MNIAIIGCKNLDEKIVNILINDNKITSISYNDIMPEILEHYQIINAFGLYVSEALIDMHCHLREPGFTDKEDVKSGTLAAVNGGYGTIVAMGNTKPAVDTVEHYKNTVDIIKKNAKNTVIQVATATINMQGKELTDFVGLKNAGAKVISDDGMPISNGQIAKNAMELAKENDMLIISHCEDLDFAKGAVNETIAKTLNVEGVSPLSEVLGAARDIMIAINYNLRVHIAHVSSYETVELIRMAKKIGANVTAETCPHYFSLTEQEVLTKGTNAKMNPPLKSEKDRKAIIEALRDGTLDAISTDHAPHTKQEKEKSLSDSPNGIIGFETAFAVAITELYKKQKFSLSQVINKFTKNPAKILDLKNKDLKEGNIADLIIFDVKDEFPIDINKSQSKSRNSPFDGYKAYGRIKYTIIKGELYENIN